MENLLNYQIKIKIEFLWLYVLSRMTNYILHLHKNAASNTEQVLKATFHKAAAVRPLTTQLKNYPCKKNQTCGTLLEK